MRINTNIASLSAQEAATNTNKTLNSSLEKLGTGLKINKAADDASGLSIADKLRTQASSIGQGISNANSASAMIQIADKAMAEQSNILDTVKSKLIQAGTATTTESGREAIRKDITKLLEQFDSIASQTNYNGVTLLQASSTSDAKADDFTFQLGEDKTFDVTLSQTKASNTAHLGGGSNTIDSAAINAASTTTDAANTDKTSNNIGVDGAQKISTSDAVTLASVNVSNDGDELATSGLDVTLSGTIGKLVSADVDGMTFDVSNETSDIQTAIAAMAGATATLTYNTTTNILTTATAGSVDFGDISFSNLGLTHAAGAASAVAFNVDGDDVEFNVTNNDGAATTPLLGQLNILQAANTATGGELLSTIKNLGENELTNAKANTYMSTIDEAITQLNSNRADFGSSQNQIESSLRSMQTTQVNLKAAESVIRDVDYAQESANFNKQNIISQAGTYAMSQANSLQQNVMRLLQ